LVDADGRVLAGAVSGGCLEGDVAAHAMAVCASGIPKRLTYDLGDDLQAIWGFGAMCNGVAHLLIEPFGTGAWLEHVVALRSAREHGALLTVLDESTAGGTRALAECPPSLCAASASLARAAAETHMPVCGAITIEGRTVQCLVDPVIPPVALVLIGAGRGADAFAQIGTTLGWHVTVMDHRPFALETLALPESVTRIVARPDDDAVMSADARTAVALLTHQFEFDRAWLTRLLPTALGYIGVLGSRQRATQLLDRLRADGLMITPRMQRVLHAPIGLDLGGESPESIALAAIAEIEAMMHGRPGGSLRERQSPIHTRTPTPHRPV
jgi:xanthine/CO dehydrogenase XdhC/CoxF family maturation factor